MQRYLNGDTAKMCVKMSPCGERKVGGFEKQQTKKYEKGNKKEDIKIYYQQEE